MPLDGVALSGVIHELNHILTDGRIDKITQPEPDEIVLTLRARGGNHKLLLTANASAPRLHFTAESKPAPLQAPMFCMMLRKQLSGGRLIKITQPEFERIAELHIEARDEMGDRAVKKLVIEIMGKHSNIILLDSGDVIADSARRVSHNTSSVREVLPGRKYQRPPSGDKQSPLGIDLSTFTERVNAQPTRKIQQAVYQSFNGISPVMASEWCLEAGVQPDAPVNSLTEAGLSNVYAAFAGGMKRVADVNKNMTGYSFTVYIDANGIPADFSALPLSNVYAGYDTRAYESISPMLEDFYRQKDTAYRINQKTTDLRKLIATHIERCVKKQAVYDKTLADIADRDRLRVYGELLTASLYRVEPGAESFTAENFYDENKPVEIKLNPELTASENAQSYFKQYNKQKRTFTALQEQIKQNNDDLTYLDSVANSLQAASDEADIAEIRAELAEEGYVKKVSVKKNAKQMKKTKPLRYVSRDGFEMYVGKNNTQNDELTLRFAEARDIWLHTKDIAGSHVIIKTNGQPVTDATLLEAANLAAYYSKARGSAQVPVDYAPRKYVRKPNGAKPGYVIYDHNRTVYVTPKEVTTESF
jgi:predicted ribosome quality control (RQC) complex YloA/Tae2 family protein